MLHSLPRTPYLLLLLATSAASACAALGAASAPSRELSASESAAMGVAAGMPASEPATGTEATHDELIPLREKLASKQETERRDAVVALAALGSAGAWNLIVDALGDASPLVADQAELAFAGLAVESIVAELAGKRGLQSSTPVLALRATGALGSVPVRVDPRVFLPALASKDAELRRLALESLERLGRTHCLDLADALDVGKELDRLRHKDKDSGVRAAAYLARIWVPVLSSKLVKPLGEELPEALAMAEMRVLAREGALSAVQQAERSLASESFALRLEAIDAIGRRPNRNTAGILAHALEHEPRERLAWAIVQRLRRMSGRSFGRDAAAWIEWHERLSLDWYPVPDPKDEPIELGPPDGAGAAIFGLTVASDHVAILVDVSSWLARPDGTGKSLEATIEAEVGAVLARLPESTSFNLVPFADAPTPFAKSLVPVNADNVRRATQAFAATKPAGKADVWEALVRASSDPAVDTLIVVTSGTASAGQYVNPDLIRQRFAERNRFQHVLVSAVVVGAPPETFKAWEALCESTGGRARAYEPVK